MTAKWRVIGSRQGKDYKKKAGWLVLPFRLRRELARLNPVVIIINATYGKQSVFEVAIESTNPYTQVRGIQSVVSSIRKSGMNGLSCGVLSDSPQELRCLWIKNEPNAEILNKNNCRKKLAILAKPTT